LTTPASIIALDSLAAWTLKGPGASEFLQGYVTSDLGTLRTGRWQVTAFCTIKGRVLATAYVTGASGEVTFLMPEDMIEPVLTSLKKYLAFARGAELVHVPKRAIASIGDLDYPAVDLPSDARLGLKLASSTKEANAAGWDESTWRWFEINAGFAQVTQPVSGAFLPQMLGLDDLGAVSFSKGCYLGQEVVTRAAHKGQVKRRIRRIALASETAPQIGQKLFDANGRECGVIVACAPNPHDSAATSALAVVSGDLTLPLSVAEVVEAVEKPTT